MLTVKLRILILVFFVSLLISACELPEENQCPEPLDGTLCIVFP